MGGERSLDAYTRYLAQLAWVYEALEERGSHHAAHLRAIADDDVRYLAHHYTRYLGDLSGGQAIAALVARHYGATPEQRGFYRFDVAEGGVVQYKRGYREAMNALALSPREVDVLIAEVRTSFRMNSAIFEALAT